MNFDYHYLWTGQRTCHDTDGRFKPCEATGQDAAFARGTAWPKPRFETRGETVTDCLTELVWTIDANLPEFPLSWTEALDYVQRELNDKAAFGFSDWRLPNRRELRSLMSYQTSKPALPEGHPFHNLFPGWYWTSTSASLSLAHAWYVHMEGARMFYGGKDQSFLVWPVRGTGNGLLPATGQKQCYDALGNQIPCSNSGQDGEFQFGCPWPRPRFEIDDEAVIDHLTGLAWNYDADLTRKRVDWDEALAAVHDLNTSQGNTLWRLPNINELESLVDCDRHSPALPQDAQFVNIRDVYWSSTTSQFEPDWAWALYIDKGAVGVGQKSGRHFFVWPVSDRRRL